MLTRKDLFPIGIGTWGIGGFAQKDSAIDANKQLKALAYMFDSGFNFVEANMWYAQGHSAKILSQALNSSSRNRHDIFLCQAIYLRDYGLEKAEAEIDQLLKLFNTEYIDSLQFTQSVFIKYSYDEVCQFVEKMLTKGKARYTSLTNHNLDLLKNYHNRFANKLFSHEVTHSLEVRVNEELGIIPYAQKNNLLTVIFQPLRRNRTALRNWPILIELSQKYHVTQNQILMNWLVSKGFLALTKSETIAHIDQHLAALKLNLDDNDLKKLDDFRPLNYTLPKIDWDKTGDGVEIDQLPNLVDNFY